MEEFIYQGHVGQGDRGRGTSDIWYNYYEAISKYKGLCSALVNHIFDYGQNASEDQMRTTWEKLVHHVLTIHGHDIINELQNKKNVNIPKPDHTQDVLYGHQSASEKMDQS